MIVIPPIYWCRVENPILKNEKNEIQVGNFGQVKLRHGDAEIRFEQEPFSLYPGEKIVGGVQPLKIIEIDTALVLRATRNFNDRYAKDKDGNLVFRKAGEEWLFKGGPKTYFPQVEVEEVELKNSYILTQTEGLHVKARKGLIQKEKKEKLEKNG